MTRVEQLRFVWKPLVFSASLVPAAWLVYVAVAAPAELGANPVEAVLDHFGNWGIRFTLLALAVTPARHWLGWPSLARFRRMIGLFAFFYVFLHFLTWLVLDQGLAWQAIIEDIAKRPFITIGMAALLLLTLMAATSFNAARRAMGRRWQQLHYAVYAVGILAVWHFWWQVKADILEPAIYAVLLTVLLGHRVARRLRGRNARPQRA